MNEGKSNEVRRPSVKIIEPPFFSNWADLFFPKIANKFIPVALQIHWLTPNHVTLLSFILYTFASLLLFIPLPYNLYLSVFLFPFAYILDCLDGQLARVKHLTSPLGDYLDKTLDVLKVYILTLSLAFAQFLKTEDAFYFVLGFTACFGFNFRYYIKLETMFSSISRDKDYLDKCRSFRYEQYEKIGAEYKELSKTLLGKLKVFWYRNRILFFIDEAEFVVITSLAAIFNRLDIALWIFAIGHLGIALFRLFERGYQLNTNSKDLLRPMRK